jgi:hypothetical protein
MASLVLILIIISNILDVYFIIRYNFYFSNTFILMFMLLLMVIIITFLIWLSNKSCYNYKWVSWIIIFYLIFSMIGTITLLINPELRESERAKMEQYNIEKDAENNTHKTTTA